MRRNSISDLSLRSRGWLNLRYFRRLIPTLPPLQKKGTVLSAQSILLWSAAAVSEREKKKKSRRFISLTGGRKKEREFRRQNNSRSSAGGGEKTKQEGETNCTPTVKRRQRRSQSEIERHPQMIPLLYPCSIDGSGENGILWVILYTVPERELGSRERQSGSFAASPLRS